MRNALKSVLSLPSLTRSIAMAGLMVLTIFAKAQPNWRLIKEQSGVKVYMANAEHSKFKTVRVLAEMKGSINKLASILTDVSAQPRWVYKTKTVTLLKRPSSNEVIYYAESIVPWPFSNRDVVIRLKIARDSINQTMQVAAASIPNYVKEKKGIVRITSCRGNWKVVQKHDIISIDYIFEINPGGDIPAWLVNSFADKGPVETFEKLRLELMK